MLAGSIAFLVIGFAILIYSGDCLVRGALAAAFKANVSPLLVGILIVGFGTSLPEFLIGVQAALAGTPGLAHGNIIGSNIANIWLVLALPAVIFPIVDHRAAHAAHRDLHAAVHGRLDRHHAVLRPQRTRSASGFLVVLGGYAIDRLVHPIAPT